jgi:hypothetical protein
MSPNLQQKRVFKFNKQKINISIKGEKEEKVKPGCANVMV